MMHELTLHSSRFALKSCSLVQPQSSRHPSLSTAWSNLPSSSYNSISDWWQIFLLGEPGPSSACRARYTWSKKWRTHRQTDRQAAPNNRLAVLIKQRCWLIWAPLCQGSKSMIFENFPLTQGLKSQTPTNDWRQKSPAWDSPVAAWPSAQPS